MGPTALPRMRFTRVSGTIRPASFRLRLLGVRLLRAVSVLLARRVRKVSKGHQAHRVTLGRKARKVMQDRRDHLATLALPGTQASQGRKENLGRQVHKVRKEIPETQAHRVFRVTPAHKDSRGLKDSRDLPEVRGRKVLQARRGQRDQKARRDRRDRMVQLALMELRARPVSMLASRGRWVRCS